jgi:hypothetical protein
VISLADRARASLSEREMSGAETVKGSTPVALSLGVVGGGELAGAADFGGAVVGVEEDVLEDEGAAKSPILLTAVLRFSQNCKVEEGVGVNSVDIGGGACGSTS